MKTAGMNSAKKQTNIFKKSSYEQMPETTNTSSMVDDIKKVGTGVFDQFFGGSSSSDMLQGNESGWGFEQKSQSQPRRREEFSLFNYQEYYEKEIIKKEIKELTEQIKREIDLLKKANASLLNEVRDIENIGIEQQTDKPGIYHIRFLEVILSILKTLREKVGDSGAWLQAMTSKKKKRGSLFANLSKKKGTQYSLSQELQATRSVQ